MILKWYIYILYEFFGVEKTWKNAEKTEKQNVKKNKILKKCTSSNWVKLVCKFLCRTKWNIFLLQEKMYDFCVEQKCREKPNVKKKVVKKNSGKKWIHLQKKKSLLIKKVFSLVSHMKKIIMCGTSEKKFLCGSQWNFFFLCGTERKSFFIGSTKMSLKNKNLWKHIHVKFSLFCCPDWKEEQKKKKKTKLWETI